MTIKKLLILSLVFMCTTSLVNAQFTLDKLGIEANIGNQLQPTIGITYDLNPKLELSARLGMTSYPRRLYYEAGFRAKLIDRPKFSLLYGLYIGGVMNSPSGFSDPTFERHRPFLRVPLTARYQINDKLSLQAELSVINTLNQSSYFSKPPDLSIGLHYRLGKRKKK